jgi:hypothetical protein
VNSLPYDICRCVASSCTQRNTCLRFTTITEDKLIKEPVRLSYSDNMCYHHDGEDTLEWEGGYKIALTDAKEK